jgi:hypothetical protein
VGVGQLYSDEVVGVSGKARWKPWHKWAGGILAALLVLQVYFVRELLAALLIFTVFFLVFAVIAGVVYAIGKAGEVGITFAEPAARRSMEVAEELSKRTFRRPRSAPAP